MGKSRGMVSHNNGSGLHVKGPPTAKIRPPVQPIGAHSGPKPWPSHMPSHFSVCPVKTFQDFTQRGYSQVKVKSTVRSSPQGSTFCAALLS